eukprot:3820206-Prymnesium_polylepis.2
MEGRPGKGPPNPRTVHLRISHQAPPHANLLQAAATRASLAKTLKQQYAGIHRATGRAAIPRKRPARRAGASHSALPRWARGGVLRSRSRRRMCRTGMCCSMASAHAAPECTSATICTTVTTSRIGWTLLIGANSLSGSRATRTPASRARLSVWFLMTVRSISPPTTYTSFAFSSSSGASASGVSHTSSSRANVSSAGDSHHLQLSQLVQCSPSRSGYRFACSSAVKWRSSGLVAFRLLP